MTSAKLKRRRSWLAVRDSVLTAAAVATVLACTLGVGPFSAAEPTPGPSLTVALVR